MSEAGYDPLMAGLPPAVRKAIEEVDLEAFQCAMDELPDEQAEQITRQLEEAGIIGMGTAGEAEYQTMLQEFDGLIQAIVDVAQGDDSQREAVLAVMPRLDAAGYHLSRAVGLIWAGERDEKKLVSGLDPNSPRLIGHILARLANASGKGESGGDDSSRQGETEDIPAAVLEAIQAQDEAAFRRAMEGLPAAERQRVAEQLARLQEQADAEADAWLASLPGEVRVAVHNQDHQHLQAALQALPPAQAEGILQELEAAGVLEEIEQSESQKILEDFEPLILAIVEAARGTRKGRPQVEELLSDLEIQGWLLYGAVQHIWEGERNPSILRAELDQQDWGGDQWKQPIALQVIQRILEEMAIPE